ncbi:GAF domain-containing sensor histidine kinase [Spongisporangium articulatum]|uniref:histidine kinase n=1 Tax=Spongisporangium articulatum TaxID=3362603 RepID=A0ABW8AS56_9ACTN
MSLRDRLAAVALTYALLATWVCAIVVVMLAVAGVDAESDSLPVWALAVGVGLGVLSAVPLHGWLRPRVDGVLFSHPDDAAGLIAAAGRRLGEPEAPAAEDVSTQLAAQIARRLRLPYAAIVTGDEPGDRPDDARLVRVPLTFAGEPVGTLLVLPRAHDRALPGPDADLLTDLAAQLGIVLHAARAAEQVLLSRAAVITAREEERRRIRRDLHDGLGPTLASLRLHLAALEQLIPARPDEAVQLAARLRGDVRETAASVRDLVYDLRPAALDELGLRAAVGARAEELGDQAGIDVRVEAGNLPDLPAAAEVALYRIAAEALANAGRHSGAATVSVHIAVDDERAVLTVLDDGRGLPEPLVPGVGLAGMRERAEELRGTFVAGPGTDGTGTRIMATLPLRRGGAE